MEDTLSVGAAAPKDTTSAAPEIRRAVSVHVFSRSDDRDLPSSAQATIGRQFHNEGKCDLLVLQLFDQFSILRPTAGQIYRKFGTLLPCNFPFL